jgi:hypothetical protein
MASRENVSGRIGVGMSAITCRILALGLVLIAMGRLPAIAEDAPHGQRQAEAGHADRRIVRSSHFAIRTDLPEAEAAEALQRMEAILKFAARYWGREPRGQIKCIIARDLENWSDGELPHSLARVWIGGVGGATISEMAGVGRSARVKSTVYANDQPGVIEHEIVHAYCSQAFGTSGPVWYKEGMAEFAAFGHERTAGVRCDPRLIHVLRHGKRLSIEQIIRSDLHVERLRDSMTAMLANRTDVNRHVALDAWRDSDSEDVHRAKRAYLWCWSLCHMLENNPNYRERFRRLGNNFLRRKRDSFQRAFEEVMDQLAFEYAFFLDHVDIGYRVDLCHWDWDRQFRDCFEWDAPHATVAAARGYQPSGLTVMGGQRWQYRTVGTWGTSKSTAPVNADGNHGGEGRLTGVVLNNYRLSQPFALGSRGEFVVPVSGDLYLRCGEEWNRLADNRGQVEVWLRRP